MQITQLLDGNTLLTYELLTSPEPLQVSPQSGRASVAQLIFVLSCPITLDQVTVTQITFNLPIGDPNAPDATDLTEVSSGISPSVSSSGSDQWQIGPGAGAGSFVLTPKDGGTAVIDKQGLTVALTGIRVSPIVGTAELSIVEKAMAANNPLQDRECTIAAPKFPYQFHAGNFRASVPMVQEGQPVTLSWIGTLGATYTLLWGTQSRNVSTVNEYTVPSSHSDAPLTDTTAFILQVVGQQGSETVTMYFNATVIVADPKITATTLEVLKTAQLRGAPNGVGLTVDAQGNVGLGTTAPAFSLDVNGTAQLRGAPGGTGLTVDANGKVGLGTTEPGSFLDVNGTVQLRGAEGGTGLTVNESGNVGVGTAYPIQSLHVLSNSFWQTAFQIENSTSNKAFQFLVGGNNNWDGAAGVGGFGIYDSVAGFRFNINANGNVGIGTTAPQAPLHVKPMSTIPFPFPYLFTSIFAEGGIIGHYCASLSDARTKNIQGRSDGAIDLGTLLGLEVTDYRYKGVIGNGRAAHKKLIAQQVEKVFPQAVGKLTHVVPDVCRRAAFRDGWVELATDLRRGERVRLISDKADGICEVLEVTAEKFRTEFKPEGDTVFVFGREVDDFRTLDYDAIAMLNVSATQQLKKEKDEEMEALRAACAELRAANDALLRRVESLERKTRSADGRRRKKQPRG